MVSLLVSFFKRIFGRTSEPAPTPAPAQHTGFNIEHEWPFPSPKPTNTDALLLELIRGVVVEGEHAFYVWEGQKRRHIRTAKGTETILARHIIWWMEGRKVPSMANGLTTTCGEPKCIKLNHLILRMPQIVHGPERPPVSAPETKCVSKKKVSPQKPALQLEKLDRSKCPTAKGYFATQAEAQRHSRLLNSPSVRGRGPRVYPYDTVCPYCLGFHLTKIKPGKYQKRSIKNSSY